MSTTDADPPVDPQEQIARIKRAQIETDTFAAEQRKLSEEAAKFAAGQRKLSEEATRLADEGRNHDRERLLAAWQLAIRLLGAVGGFVAGTVTLWHMIVR
jgi:hypothetical protein